MFKNNFLNYQKLETKRCPSISEWVNKLGWFHPMESYYRVKRKKPLIHVTKWMNHKGIMLNERSQSQKITYDSI